MTGSDPECVSPETISLSQVIVIGLGNRFRQDDAVGLIVAQRIQERVQSTVRVIEHAGDPLDLLTIWSGYELAILIDALNLPGAPGKIRRFDPDIDLPPRRETIFSSHGHSLWDAFELANLLGQRPERALVFAISGNRFDYGEDLSPEVEQAIESTIACVLATLSAGRDLYHQ